MKKRMNFVITAPPQSIYVALAVGIVHNEQAGWATLGMLVLYGTIVENWLNSSKEN